MQPTLLLVDDEPLILNGLKDAIDWRAFGIERICLASDGEQALLVSQQQEIQLIVTDIMMPRMDGLEYVRQLRAFNRTAKIIILSGYDRFEFAQRALRLGVNEYLLKPLTNAELEGAVRRVMNAAVLPETQAKQETPALEEAVRSAFYGQDAAGEAPEDFPKRYFVCMVKLSRSKDAPGSYPLWSGIVRDALLPEGVRFFDVSESRAFLFCPFKENGNYLALAQTVYEKIADLCGAASDALALFVSLPADAPNQLPLIRQQLESLERLRVQQNGIEYVRDLSGLRSLRPEIRKALEYIQYNYSQPLTLDEVANFVHLSSNYLSNTFKAEIGENYSSFLARTRIEQAARLLLSGHGYVYQVAASVGYRDVVYFSKLFRKYIGCTPQEYIRQKYNSEA